MDCIGMSCHLTSVYVFACHRMLPPRTYAWPWPVPSIETLASFFSEYFNGCLCGIIFEYWCNYIYFSPILNLSQQFWIRVAIWDCFPPPWNKDLKDAYVTGDFHGNVKGLTSTHTRVFLLDGRQAGDTFGMLGMSNGFFISSRAKS